MWVSVAKQASYTHKLFTAWVSATKQASHTHKLSIAWVSATKQASHTLKLSIAWVSAAKQASHTHKLFTLRRKKGTKKLAPIICAHAEEEEGYREACTYHLCPRWGGRRVQRSLFLSPVPTLRKKGTEKLAPIICAHAEEEEGYREACTYHLCPHWGGRRVQRSLFLSPVPTLRQKNGHRRNLSCLRQPYAMSHAIHKIASKRCCQSYFISRRSPHHGKNKNRDLWANSQSRFLFCLCAAMLS